MDQPSPPAASDLEGLGGSTIQGRYRILSLLGKGAMGVVFLGHDERLDRRVAIKTIRSDASAGVVGRRHLSELILRESRVVARMTHPGIVQVFDACLVGDSSAVIFEYVEGITLQRLLDGARSPLSAEEVCSHLRQILEPMAYAHSQGIVHCDLKPGNVIASRGGPLKVMDFGVALALRDPRLNMDFLGGSPAYMSPEQTRDEPLQPSSDVFSIGVMAYELLAREKPFYAENEERLFNSIQNERPKPLRSGRGDLSPEFEEVIDRAMAKSRANRFPDAAAMLEALLKTPESQASLDSPPSQARLSALVERNRLAEAIASDSTEVAPPVADLRRFALPELSAVSSELLQLAGMSPDEVETGRLVRLIERDPALSARILRVANSPVYGHVRQIGGLRHAVTMIGMRESLNLVHYYSFLTTLESLPRIEGLPLEELWKHCWTCALSAQALGRPDFLVGSTPGELYLAGLLHDIGKIMIAAQLPAEYEKCLRTAREEGIPLFRAEREQLGFDHAQVAGQALEGWNLPTPILNAIRWHHQPEEAGADFHELAAYTEYANIIANFSGIGFSGNTAGYRLAESCIGRERKGPAASPESEQRLLLEVIEGVWRHDDMTCAPEPAVIHHRRAASTSVSGAKPRGLLARLLDRMGLS